MPWLGSITRWEKWCQSFKKADLAQEELKTLSGINEENAGKKTRCVISNVALTDIKTAVANAKQNNQDLSKDDIRKIVETLKNYKLDTTVTGNQINLIVNFAAWIFQRVVLSVAKLYEDLSDLKDSIVDMGRRYLNNINQFILLF